VKDMQVGQSCCDQCSSHADNIIEVSWFHLLLLLIFVVHDLLEGLDVLLFNDILFHRQFVTDLKGQTDKEPIE
jgi:hypothetical protein